VSLVIGYSCLLVIHFNLLYLSHNTGSSQLFVLPDPAFIILNDEKPSPLRTGGMASLLYHCSTGYFSQ
jgi:hypothetical protein